MQRENDEEEQDERPMNMNNVRGRRPPRRRPGESLRDFQNRLSDYHILLERAYQLDPPPDIPRDPALRQLEDIFGARQELRKVNKDVIFPMITSEEDDLHRQERQERAARRRRLQREQEARLDYQNRMRQYRVARQDRRRIRRDRRSQLRREMDMRYGGAGAGAGAGSEEKQEEKQEEEQEERKQEEEEEQEETKEEEKQEIEVDDEFLAQLASLDMDHYYPGFMNNLDRKTD